MGLEDLCLSQYFYIRAIGFSLKPSRMHHQNRNQSIREQLITLALCHMNKCKQGRLLKFASCRLDGTGRSMLISIFLHKGDRILTQTKQDAPTEPQSPENRAVDYPCLVPYEQV